MLTSRILKHIRIKQTVFGNSQMAEQKTFTDTGKHLYYALCMGHIF